MKNVSDCSKFTNRIMKSVHATIRSIHAQCDTVQANGPSDPTCCLVGYRKINQCQLFRCRITVRQTRTIAHKRGIELESVDWT